MSFVFLRRSPFNNALILAISDVDYISFIESHCRHDSDVHNAVKKDKNFSYHLKKS